ncbi:MAG: hypothetical protein A3H02_01765 [Candidatus Niyogibacteria bacterium RIFCSPLOWO2_12_FULL_41_13]|uniref:Glycosyl transferase family 1 domain-containing protein n=1 Tax=Candidatus Niyogibacteria bacterium RIFCSPLOWO2_12_FULL_41_13 TaxID=1801726 RepID=A0A1G2F2I2_9BACT|nr:MAG: hypothetical protein A3H02_01765 [Candidatus Niyogibacteria bacterium RIFCSPLOWO2_12_FULL_41_13]
MKILMLSSDPLVLDKDSFVRKRIEKYGELVEKLIVIVIANRLPALPAGADKILIIPVFGGFLRFFRALSLAQKILKTEKVDLIACQDIEHCLIAFLLGKPFEAQIHTDIGSPYFWKHSFKNKLRYFFAKFLLKKASCVRVVSERIQKFLIEEWKISSSKIALIPILPTIRYPRAISFARMSFSRKDFGFKKTILMVSRLAKEKNIALAIKAFAEVSKTNPDAGLVIIGDGPERKNLELQAASHKLKAKIRFEGYQKNLVPYYLSAHAFLLTSWYEGFGMSLIEAIYFGLPIAMSDVGIAGEIIKNNESALMVQPGDLGGFVNALDRILNEEELRKKIVDNARKNLGEFLGKHQDYYQEIIVNWQKCGE